jgi:hypothetical protein
VDADRESRIPVGQNIGCTFRRTGWYGLQGACVVKKYRVYLIIRAVVFILSAGAGAVDVDLENQMSLNRIVIVPMTRGYNQQYFMTAEGYSGFASLDVSRTISNATLQHSAREGSSHAHTSGY